MTQHRDFRAHDRLPPSWLDALEEYASTQVSGNFLLELNTSTSLKIVAGSGNDQVTVGIAGKWRYNTSTVTAEHPGGAAGTHDVFVTASANEFSLNPSPPPIDLDTTDYTFDLVILTSGVPATAHYRKCGYVVWNGSEITTVEQTIGSGGFLSPGPVATSGIGDMPVDGTTRAYARSDHKHLVTRVQSGSHGARVGAATQGRIYYNTSKDEVQRDSGSAWRTANRARVLTLAEFGALTDVEDGDEVSVLVDANAGVIWRFAYRQASTSAFKWEFVGGPPVLSETTGSILVESADYGGTGGPQISVPRAGEYEVALGCDFSFSGVAETISDAVLRGGQLGGTPTPPQWGPLGFYIGDMTYTAGSLFVMMIHMVDLDTSDPPWGAGMSYSINWNLIQSEGLTMGGHGVRVMMFWGIGDGNVHDTLIWYLAGYDLPWAVTWCLAEIPSGFNAASPIGETNYVVDEAELDVGTLASQQSRVIVMKARSHATGSRQTSWEGGWDEIYDAGVPYPSSSFPLATAFGPAGDDTVTWTDGGGDGTVAMAAEIRTLSPDTYYMSYDIGATDAVDRDAARTSLSEGLAMASGFRSRRKSSLPATTLTSRYRKRTNDAASVETENRVISILPIRVA